MKDFDRACAARDDAPFGKADPLTGILPEQRVALYPIFGFILLPIRMDPLGNLRRQTFDQASHGLSRSAHVTIIHGLSLKSKGESEETEGQKMDARFETRQEQFFPSCFSLSGLVRFLDTCSGPRSNVVLR
jgi:hypothetical protein